MRWSADIDSYLSTGEASWSSKEMPAHSRPLLAIRRVEEPRTRALIPEHMPVAATSMDEATCITAVLLKLSYPHTIISSGHSASARQLAQIALPTLLNLTFRTSAGAFRVNYRGSL